MQGSVAEARGRKSAYVASPESADLVIAWTELRMRVTLRCIQSPARVLRVVIVA